MISTNFDSSLETSRDVRSPFSSPSFSLNLEYCVDLLLTTFPIPQKFTFTSFSYFLFYRLYGKKRLHPSFLASLPPIGSYIEVFKAPPLLAFFSSYFDEEAGLQVDTPRPL